MRQIFMRQIIVFTFYMFIIAPAWACTLCYSERAAQVRQGVFDENFLLNVMITLLPFSIFLFLTSLIYYGGWRQMFASRPSDSTGAIHE